MKIFFVQILTYMLLTAICCGQIVRSPLSNQYTGAVTYSKKKSDVFSFTGNQAALGDSKITGVGVYGEKKFDLNALSNYHAVVQVPLQNSGIGLNAYYFGDAQFNETQAGLAYGKKLSKSVSIGAQINYNQVRIAGYGSASAVSFELGTLWSLSDKVLAGFHVYNPVGGKYGKNGSEKLAAIYKAGIGYEVSDNFFASAEIAKEEDKPVNVNAAVQYNFLDNFFMRGGVSTANANYFVGAGFILDHLRLDVLTSYHRQLGFSPALMLIFNFKKKTEE